MAIKYLDSLDISGTEIQNVRAQSITSNPTPLGEGQFFFDSTLKVIKYYDGTNWITLDGSGDISGVTAGSGLSGGGTSGNVTVSVDYAGADNIILEAQDLSASAIGLTNKIMFSDGSNDVSFANVSDLPFSNKLGTVTSVSQTHGGNAFTVGGSPVTSSGTLAITMAGTAAQYINGLGNLITFPADAGGTVTSVATTNGTFVNVTGGTITSSGTITGDLSATGTPSSSTYLRGDNTWATVPGGYTSFSLKADTGTANDILDGDTVDISGGTGISTVIASAGSTSTVEVKLDNTSVTAAAYTSANITVDAQGRITAAASGAAGTMNDFDVDGDSGPTQTISDGNNLTIKGGTALTTVASATDIITVNHDNFGTAATSAYPSSITTNAQGHVTAVTAGSAPGTMSNFSVSGDGGTTQSITQGDTLSFSGGVGIVTTATATDNVTIRTDLNELPSLAAIGFDNDIVFLQDQSDQGKVAMSSVPLTLWGAPQASLSIGTQKLINVVDPTAAQDGATKNYVDTTFAGSGALIFQGGYAANTAAPSGAGVLKGFTYVVTVAGTGVPANYWSPTLEVGDLIIANQNAPTNASQWTEVNKNIDVATATVQGIANFPTAGGLSVAAGAVSMATTGPGAGSVGSASQSLSITTDVKGRVTARTAQSIAIAASQVTNFCAEVESCVAGASREKTGTIGSATSWTITHNMGTRNVTVDVYSNSGTYADLRVTVTRPSINTITISVFANPGANALNYMIQKIGA